MFAPLPKVLPALSLALLLFQAPALGGNSPLKLDTKALPEASGLAASSRDASRLWAHNDGGYAPVIFLLDHDGRLQGQLEISGAENEDWEDIAAFVENDQPQLMLADIGDNTGRRDYLTLYFIEEPATTADGELPDSALASVQRQLRVRLPDGPADLEGAAVDADREEILLLTKRAEPPQLFRVPLYPDNAQDGVVTAESVARISTLPGPDLDDVKANFTMAPFLRQPTALDYDAGSDSYLITTYADAHIYRRQPGDQLADGFRRRPLTVELPLLPQMEGGSFCGNGKLCFISEKLPARLLIVDAPGD